MKLDLGKSERSRILNLHSNFVDIPGRRLNEQDELNMDDTMDKIRKAMLNHLSKMDKEELKKFLDNMTDEQREGLEKMMDKTMKSYVDNMLGLNEQEISPGLDSLMQMGDEFGFDKVKDGMSKFTNAMMDSPMLDVWKKVKDGLQSWVESHTGAELPALETGDTFSEWWGRWTPEQQEAFIESTGVDRETIESLDIGMNTAPGSPLPMNEQTTRSSSVDSDGNVTKVEKTKIASGPTIPEKSWLHKTWDQLADNVKKQIMTVKLPKWKLFKRNKFKGCIPRKGKWDATQCPEWTALSAKDKKEVMTESNLSLVVKEIIREQRYSKNTIIPSGLKQAMREEDWMQKADKDIEKKGTQGVFHKWCVDHGYKDGCDSKCWTAAKKEGSPWSMRANLAKAFCESKH